MTILSRRTDGSFIPRATDGKFEQKEQAGIVNLHGQGVAPGVVEPQQPDVKVLDQNDPAQKVAQEAERAASE